MTTSKNAMDEDYLACSYSTESQCHAILDDNGLTGIVYLHEPSDDPKVTGEVIATCFAFNRIVPIELEDVQSYRPNPPPIAKGYASKVAVCRKPKSHRWDLIWSTDGESVVLQRDGIAWALVSIDNRRGLSKAIEVEGPWGRPWSDKVYESSEWATEGTT